MLVLQCHFWSFVAEVVINLYTIYMMSKIHHKYNNMCGGWI
jgi:hypothetical protein